MSCGDVITENTTLDSDLECFDVAAPAITIGANRVKLDLSGHTISSNSIGILNEGRNRVRIVNGSVGSPFGSPIVLRHANRNRLVNLEAGGGGGAAVALEDSDRNRLRRNRFGADAGGVSLRDGSDRNRIKRNELSGGIGGGLGVTDSDRNVVARNVIEFGAGEQSPALVVRAGSDRTTLRRNELQGGFQDGLVVAEGTTKTLVFHNQVRGYRLDGIRVDSPSATLTGNSSNDNGGWGILAVAGVTDGGGNTASGNGAGQCLNVSC